ncbi:hypothetical protein D3C78_1218660 [compost metagenome]
MLGDVQVDHELRQGAVQTGNRAAQQGETGAGQLGGGFEVQPAELLAQGDVVLNREIEGSRGAPAAHFDVAVFVFADRYRFVRQVGDTQQDRVQIGLDRVQFDFTGAQFARHALDVRHQRRDVFPALLGLTDGFGTRVTLSLQCFGAGLDGLALFFQRFDARNIQHKATGCQAVRYVLKVAT